MCKLSNVLLSALLPFAFNPLAYAAETPVKVKVPLTVGSFDLTAAKVIGSGEKKGGVYTAKEIKVKVDDMTTGQPLRDKHTKEHLESAKYPFITVSDIKASGGSGTAKITVKGITKEIKFIYKDAGPGKATADFKLNLKDFKFSGISYLGVGVEDEVQVTATLPYSGS